MDCQDVVALIAEIRHLDSELDDVETKTAQGGLPERIYRSLSALSNRRGGGVILFGVDEEQRFAVVGVPDVARLQQELASIASEMRPPLRLHFDVCEVEEYPEFAIREAIRNAVAPRDYTARGSHTDVRLFADRLEVRNPGGLFGDLTVETLDEAPPSTRNPNIVRVLQDLGYVEQRGTGIRRMIAEMRQVNLEPPHFKDAGTYFLVTLKNHTLLDEETLAWLNQFADYPLNERRTKRPLCAAASPTCYWARGQGSTGAEVKAFSPAPLHLCSHAQKGSWSRGSTAGAPWVERCAAVDPADGPA